MALQDPPEPPVEPERLFLAMLERTHSDDAVEGSAFYMTFNRAVTDEELEHMRRLPPVTQVAKDAQHFAERVILAELAVRMFRILVLGNFVHEESPKAMQWLKDWVDGTMEGHGPMGSGPMRWPDQLPFVAGLLRQLGFQPTPSMPPYVMRVGPAVAVVVDDQGEPV